MAFRIMRLDPEQHKGGVWKMYRFSWGVLGERGSNYTKYNTIASEKNTFSIRCMWFVEKKEVNRFSENDINVIFDVSIEGNRAS